MVVKRNPGSGSGLMVVAGLAMVGAAAYFYFKNKEKDKDEDEPEPGPEPGPVSKMAGIIEDSAVKVHRLHTSETHALPFSIEIGNDYWYVDASYTNKGTYAYYMQLEETITKPDGGIVFDYNQMMPWSKVDPYQTINLGLTSNATGWHAIPIIGWFLPVHFNWFMLNQKGTYRVKLVLRGSAKSDGSNPVVLDYLETTVRVG